MNLALVATVISILGCGGIFGLLGKVWSMGMKYQDLLNRVAHNEQRDEEERKENAFKFNELYNSRNKTNETLVELTTTVKMMVSNMDQQFNNLSEKIDELKDEKKRKD